MRGRITMRILWWLSILTVAASAFASEFQSKEFKPFVDGVRKYVELQQYLEGSVSAQKSTNESQQIADRQQQLTGLMAGVRRDSRQGELFTDEVAEQFHTIIRKAFKEPGGRAMRKTIEERDPVKHIVLKVNEVYPDNQPRTTMSPT